MKQILIYIILATFFAVGSINPLMAQTPEQLYQKGLMKEEGEGALQDAINFYNQIANNSNADKSLQAKALLHIGMCYEKLGMKEATKAYQRLVNTCPDQTEMVALAKGRLAALGGSGGTGGLVTRRVLADASGVDGFLTPDAKYIRSMDQGTGFMDYGTGDVVQFEVASGQKSRIKYRGPKSETKYPIEFQVFSRDGKQIAYNSVKDSVLPLQIRNLDGSGLRILYSDKDYVQPLDWSPDAGFILALRDHDNDNTSELTLISTADGSERVLRNFTSVIIFPQTALFSPDGRSVAFSSGREGSPPHGDVFLMTADGRNEVVVAGHPAEDRLLRWTPDGRGIVFLSDRSGTWDIWTVRINGGKQQGEPELLKKDFGYYSEVFGFAPGGSCYYKTQTSSGRLYNGEVDLETGKVLVPPALVTTRYTGAVVHPTWSPDGRNLLYISRGGSRGPEDNILTIRSAATGEERLLSTCLRWVDNISWAPDGHSFLAVGATPMEMGILRIDTETGGITKLADHGDIPNLCPDGKTLVLETDGPSITKRDLDTGEESEVVKIWGIIKNIWRSYDLSPDGREVVFQVDGAVKAVSLNGGEPRELFRGLAKSYALKWTRTAVTSLPGQPMPGAACTRRAVKSGGFRRRAGRR
jgi:Tol biopolymer transport system component